MLMTDDSHFCLSGLSTVTLMPDQGDVPLKRHTGAYKEKLLSFDARMKAAKGEWESHAS